MKDKKTTANKKTKKNIIVKANELAYGKYISCKNDIRFPLPIKIKLLSLKNKDTILTQKHTMEVYN
tara:strand:- start:112 stop:309 length:198 start_codon:yes stop_codon:yes gene_type:complete